jgi:hypothetical protein
MIGYFIGQIEKAQTLLKADYRSVTVSASISPTSLYVSVKSPYWTHEMERYEEDAPDMPLSKWIYREVRSTHTPDIIKAAQAAEGDK